MMKIAVLITVFNRKEKTKRCLDSILSTVQPYLGESIELEVFLTDDGSTDGTREMLSNEYENDNVNPNANHNANHNDNPNGNLGLKIRVLQGDGTLFWNGGMINSWKAAIAAGGFDGYLWLNNDTVVLPEFWKDLLHADSFSVEQYKKKGIYVGSTRDHATGSFTYGGFVYTNKLTLKDKFIIPDGTHFQECEAAHGNITYVSSEVVERMGLFCEKYHHGGSDHDYTYLAHKAGFPILVLPHYSGECENDHPKDGGRKAFFALSLKERMAALNLHNTLLFNRRCFPWRYPLILFTGYFKALMPKTYYWLYLFFRRS